MGRDGEPYQYSASRGSDPEKKPQRLFGSSKNKGQEKTDSGGIPGLTMHLPFIPQNCSVRGAYIMHIIITRSGLSIRN